jgi:hypothetical protein
MKMNICDNAIAAGPPVDEDNLGSSTFAITLLQFSSLALGYMTVTILNKVEGGEDGLSGIANGLANAGLWVLLIPLVWYVAATIVARVCGENLARQVIGWTGGVLTLCIILVLVLSVF